VNQVGGNDELVFDGHAVVIDPEGRVAHVIPKVSPKSHDEQVLKVLGDL